MDVPMQASVYGTDGLYGRSTAVVINPETRQATYIVVKEKGV